MANSLFDKVGEAVTWYKINFQKYSDFAKKVEEIIHEIMNEYPDVKIYSFQHRAKGIDSFEEKCKKDKYSDPIKQITDLAGVRIITYQYCDVRFISKIVKRTFKLDTKNSVDKTALLGSDKIGYRANHFIVSLGEERENIKEYKKYKNLKCEIQVTSLLQHMWSEITHERGYKHAGALPAELDRRKNLLAALFEIGDNEFEKYVKDFNRYAQNVIKMTEKGHLDMPINSTTLGEYMKRKFSFIKDPVFRDLDMVLDELNRYDLQSIDALDRIINNTANLLHEIKDEPWRSYDGIIRNFLIINDADKYFKRSWPRVLSQMNKKNYDLYKRYNVNIEEICVREGIQIV